MKDKTRFNLNKQLYIIIRKSDIGVPKNKY